MLTPSHKTTYFLFLLVGALCCLVSAFEDDTSVKKPGILVRVTKSTFDYVTNIAISQAVKDVKSTSIPDQGGKKHGIKYHISGIKVDSFDIKSHAVEFVPNQGMHYRFSDINAVIRGRIELKALVKTHTNFVIKVYGLNVDMDLNVALNTATGRPKAAVGNCNNNDPKLHVHFDGGSSKIIKMFSKYFDKMILSYLKMQICSSSTISKINSDIEKALQKVPTSENILDDFTLDFRLLKNPDIKPTFMDTEHKGEVFWLKNRKECPLPVPTMEALPVSSAKSMATIQVSTYSLNSFAYVAFQNKYFHYILNSKNIPIDGLLNTTCESVCIGKLIPELAEAYPNKEVSILIEGTDLPEANISNGYLMLNGTIALTIYLSTDSPDKPLLIIPIKTHTVSTANIVDEVLRFKISELKLKLEKVKKVMPIKIDVEQLQHMINFGINYVLIPRINQKGHEGFPVPQVVNQLKLINMKFQLGLNSAIFMTDFRINPNFGSAEEDDF